MIGGLLIGFGFPLVDMLDGKGRMPNFGEALSFVGTVGVFIAFMSLIYTLPCALIILLPLETAFRARLHKRPISTISVMAILAGLGGIAVALVADEVRSVGSVGADLHWAERIGGLALTLPFSLSAAIALSLLTLRAMRRRSAGV